MAKQTRRLPAEGFINVPNLVVTDYLDGLALRHLRVLLVLWGFAGYESKRADPSLEFTRKELAEWTALHRRELNRAIDELVAAGWLPAPQQVGRYKLRFDRVAVLTIRDALRSERVATTPVEADCTDGRSILLQPCEQFATTLEQTDTTLGTKSATRKQESSSNQEDACMPAALTGGDDSGGPDMDQLVAGLQKYHVSHATARQWA